MQVLNDYKQKRDMLWGLLNQIPPFDFGDEFFKLQNKLLSSETNEKQIITLNDLCFNNTIAIFLKFSIK